MSNFCTKDVEEAAFLMCQEGLTFEEAERREKSNGGAAIFFHLSGMEQSEMNALRKAYFNRQTLVEPKMYSQHLVDIRTILFSALKREG